MFHIQCSSVALTTLDNTPSSNSLTAVAGSEDAGSHVLDILTIDILEIWKKKSVF